MDFSLKPPQRDLEASRKNQKNFKNGKKGGENWLFLGKTVDPKQFLRPHSAFFEPSKPSWLILC